MARPGPTSRPRMYLRRSRTEHRARVRFKPGTAYVAMYRYLLGDFAPYIYRTDDYGKTWTRLTDGKNGIAADEPTRVVREDPARPGLLYAGTEFGMYLSMDRGASWKPFQLNLPAVAVTDIKLAHGDLILSTQGRGFYILDNLSPLHQLPNQWLVRREHSLQTADCNPHSQHLGQRSWRRRGAVSAYWRSDRLLLGEGRHRPNHVEHSRQLRPYHPRLYQRASTSQTRTFRRRRRRRRRR